MILRFFENQALGLYSPPHDEVILFHFTAGLVSRAIK